MGTIYLNGIPYSSGASIANISKSDYDNLSQAEKLNGTVYMVTIPAHGDSGITSLMHFESFISKDETGKIWNAANSKYNVVAGNAKFGEQCYALNNNTNYYLTASEPYSDFDFSNKNFTIDMWINPIDTTSRHAIFSMSPNGGGQYRLAMDISVGGIANMWMSSNGSSWNVVTADNNGNGKGTIALQTGVWQHVALVRNNEYLTLYIDGNKSVEVNVGTSSVYFGNGLFRLGMWNNASTYIPKMYVDEFCVRNYAAWTDEFTPPTEPYEFNVPESYAIYYMDKIYGKSL